MGEGHLFIGWGDLVPHGLINFSTERVFAGRSALPASAFLHAFSLESSSLRFISLCSISLVTAYILITMEESGLYDRFSFHLIFSCLEYKKTAW
jgi:hypothetical protein